MLGWKKKKPEELPDFLKDEIKLDDYDKGLLKDLKRWIRKKQIEHVKTKGDPISKNRTLQSIHTDNFQIH